MAKAVGIDLGTTNSAVGLKRLDTEIILNQEGDPLTPSVVGYRKAKGLFRSGEFVVGRHALEWMRQDPENTIVSIKRLMGRNFSDEDVQRVLQEKRYAYTLKRLTSGSEHSVAVLLGETEYKPEQISAKVLEKVKGDCEKRLGEPVEYAVVTVPAYFNDKQKHATRMAAALAGLKVQRLLPEPTAAAISFGVDGLAEGQSKTVLVFDLGGGTFDISVLTIAGGQFIEQGKGGDMWMGGDDIDNLITRYVYRQTEQDNDVTDLSALLERLPAVDKNRFLGDLRSQVEAAKLRLSTRDKAVVEILGLLRDEEGDILDVEVELTRAQFEELLRPFVDKAVALTKKVIEDINFELELIDQVVMVGGSSCIPMVVKSIQQLFGEAKVLVHDRPMLAIAEGAAILAHRLADVYECPACGREVAQADAACGGCGFDLMANLAKKGVVDIVHASSHDYYLDLEDGNGELLVEKNTPLPFKTQGIFKLMHPEQRLAHFKFYNTVNKAKESIGDLWLSFDFIEDKDEDETPEVLLDFELDVNNIITVSATLKDLPEVRVSRTLSRGGTDEHLFLELERSIGRVNEEKHAYYVAYDFLERSSRIARIINQVVDPETGEEDPEALRNAERLQKLAVDMVEKEESALSNIYYAENFVVEYGPLLRKSELESLENKTRELKGRHEHGTLEQIIKAREALLDELHKHPVLLAVNELEQAADQIAREDPAKAPRYDNYLRDVRQAMAKGDKETFMRLIDEIMPEVDSILRGQSEKELRIWKGVRK